MRKRSEQGVPLIRCQSPCFCRPDIYAVLDGEPDKETALRSLVHAIENAVKRSEDENARIR